MTATIPSRAARQLSSWTTPPAFRWRGTGVNGVTRFWWLLAAGAEAAVEGDVEGVERGFPPVGPSLAAASGGVEADDREVEVLEGGLLGWEVALGLDRPAEPGVEGLALVVQMIVRISLSKARNGTNSAQAFCQSRMIAG
jgi:hypothetical protein